MEANFELCRKFDLYAAKTGHPLANTLGYSVEYIGHSPNCVESGRVVVHIVGNPYPVYISEEGHSTYSSISVVMKPLLFVEGLPVYSDNVLYFAGNPTPCTLHEAKDINGGGFVIQYVGDILFYPVNLMYLTWKKPLQKKSGWINVYVKVPFDLNCVATTSSFVWETEELASAHVAPGVRATTKQVFIEWEE